MIRQFFLVCFFFHGIASHAVPLTKEFLQGQWTLEKIWRAEDFSAPAEEYSPPWPGDNIWVFEGDSLSRFHYPFTFLGKDFFKVDTDGIYSLDKSWQFTTAWADSGRLIVGMRDGITLRFHRDTFSSDTVHLLRTLHRDTLNAALLTENYYMVTHFVPDDEAAYDFKPPLKMQMKISISDTSEALTMLRSGTIYLKAGHRKRKFHVNGVGWDNSYYAHRSEFVAVDVPILTLSPGDWWKGEPFEVVYRANEKEMAHKKR